MIYILPILFFGMLFIGNIKYKKYCNPITLFIGVFLLGVFALLSSDFFKIKLITNEVWTIYIVSMLCFLFGILLQNIVNVRIKSTFPERDYESEKRIYLKEISVIFTLTLMATIVFWMYRIVSMGFSGFLSELLTTKENENIGGLPTVVLYIKMLSVFLSPYVLNFIIEYKEKKFKYIFMIAFSFLANLGYSRNVLFYILILDLLVFLYSSRKEAKKISFKWLIYVLAVVFAVRFFAFTQVLLNKQFNIQGSILGRQLSGSVITIISYFAGPLVSTSIYMDRQLSVPFLGYTLRSIYSILNSFGLIHMNTTAYMPTEFVYIPFRFNTTTLQLYVFKEGGWIWLILFFTFLGFISESLFWKYSKQRNRYTLMILLLVSLLLITSIRSYIFTRLDMFLYFITLISIVVARRIKVYQLKGRK